MYIKSSVNKQYYGGNAVFMELSALDLEERGSVRMMKTAHNGIRN